MNRKGMAIPIILVFLGLMSITAIMLVRSNRQDLPLSFHNLKHLQMKYLAKGAMQHARLKMKLLSTQAYDAAAYAVGKNPLYDHSAAYPDYMLTKGSATLGPTQKSSASGGVVTNPGPAFLTGKVIIDGLKVRREEVTDIDFDSSDDEWADFAGLTDNDRALFQNPDSLPALQKTNLALVRFYEDISTVDHRTDLPIYPKSQVAIKISSGIIRAENTTISNPDPVTGVPDLFSACYRVQEMKVLASKGAQLYGEEAIAVRVFVEMSTKGFLPGAEPEAIADPGEGYQGLPQVGNQAFFKEVSGTLVDTSIYRVTRTLN